MQTFAAPCSKTYRFITAGLVSTCDMYGMCRAHVKEIHASNAELGLQLILRHSRLRCCRWASTRVYRLCRPAKLRCIITSRSVSCCLSNITRDARTVPSWHQEATESKQSVDTAYGQGNYACAQPITIAKVSCGCPRHVSMCACALS